MTKHKIALEKVLKYNCREIYIYFHGGKLFEARHQIKTVQQKISMGNENSVLDMPESNPLTYHDKAYNCAKKGLKYNCIEMCMFSCRQIIKSLT